MNKYLIVYKTTGNDLLYTVTVKADNFAGAERVFTTLKERFTIVQIIIYE